MAACSDVPQPVNRIGLPSSAASRTAVASADNAELPARRRAIPSASAGSAAIISVMA
jgi:hypothetical protein